MGQAGIDGLIRNKFNIRKFQQGGVLVKPKDITRPFQATLEPGSTLKAAIEAMQKCALNIIPVTDDRGQLLGILTRSKLFDLLLQEQPLSTIIKPFYDTDVISVPEGEFYDVEKLFAEFISNEGNSKFSKISTVIITDSSGTNLTGVITKEELIQYLMKEAYRLKKQLELALEATQEELRRVKLKQKSKYSFRQFITNDSYMKQLISMAQKAARQNSTVLIQGESGTGKEWFAHAIHQASQRAGGPFITVNCAAFPEHLLESEFFGYEEGAFTGANKQGKYGKLDLAHGGTLFLDEIGDMSLSLQSKLLRVLQEKEFYRVGGTEKISVDVRVIAASNQSLENLVTEKKFREDLLYRLNVVTFNLPPLRERGEDLTLLADNFIKELDITLNTNIKGINSEAMDRLKSYHWPGNIRELRNVIERVMIFTEQGEIGICHLPDKIKGSGWQTAGGDNPSQVNDIMEQKQKEVILEVLEQTSGNKTQAAKALGMSRSTLYEKIKKFGLSV